MGFMSDGRSSIQRKFDEFFGKKSIGEQCTEETLEKLHEAFTAAENERMDESQLQIAFEKILNIRMDPEERHILFEKINFNRNGFVTWDELVSYVLLEFEEKDTSSKWQALESPLSGLPLTLRTHHRSPISRILFCPEVLPDRTSSFLKGCYMTASKDGFINYWSLDLVYERSVQSVTPYRRVRPTTITDFIAMPDVQIVCTSSTERDLRFYDTVAKKFDLRVMISSFECAVVRMSYHFSVNTRDESYIILGDMNGSVIVMSFSSVEKGPFKHTPNQDVSHSRYEAVVKGELKGLKVTEFRNVHSNWVSQVAYYETLRAFVSCSKCSKCSLLVSDPEGTKMTYKFSVPNGISCFTFCEDNQWLITGGPDCTIRIWNPFVTDKAIMTLRGHHAAICVIVVQNAGKRLYTVSKDRCIKVWDVGGQTCIQTYNRLPSELGEHTELSIIYNPVTHKMIIASMMIAVIVCEKVIDEESSDGFTHAQPVSCVLYNSLFKVIVTTGLDSCIIVWDPWLGRRFHLVKNAHSHVLFGQCVGIEITAACFDNSEQLLLTGARDGSLKMWNFNTGTCIRKMAIEDNCEVTSVIWLKNRILCAGWNRHVTEFADTETGIHKKNWETRHTEDVLCAAVMYPQVLATGSYNGEIVLWRLETGQPYRRYQGSDPKRRYTIVYKKEARDKFQAQPTKGLKRIAARKRTSGRSRGPSPSAILRNDASVVQESALGITRTVAVRAIIFLTARQTAPDVGSLLVSLDSGLIQVWTHHVAAGFLVAFSAIHTRGDCALSLATDPDNEYLITGHAAGYIKVWLVKNYALPNPPRVSVPLLRLEFPFLWHDRINGRVKRSVQDQPMPMLLSSIRGHTEAVKSLQYIPNARIVVSGSADHSVRLWTLGGRYLATLGTFRPWSTILPDRPAHSYFTNYRIPPDIRRIASFTTLKVLRGGLTEERIEDKTDELVSTIEVPESERSFLYGTRLAAPILGESFELLSATKPYDETPILDNSLAYFSLSYIWDVSCYWYVYLTTSSWVSQILLLCVDQIPVYAHLTIGDLKTIEILAKPAILQKQDTVRSLMLAVKKLKKVASSVRKDKSGEYGLKRSSTIVEEILSTRQDRTIL